MKNSVGSPVEGENFYGRENEIAKIWQSLEGSNLLLLAPRRIGKTSLMKKLVKQAPSQNYQAFYMTVEGATDEGDFVQRVYQAVMEKHPKLMKKWYSKISESDFGNTVRRTRKVIFFGSSVELSENATKNWAESMNQLGKMLASLDKSWLLVIDELPLFILKLLKEPNGTSRTEIFLHRLRELRQTQPQLRWLLAGSIGLDTVAARYRLGDTINDLRITGLGSFSHEVADSFLQELSSSHNIELTSSIRSKLLNRLQWLLPYYLQLVFSELLENYENLSNSSDSEFVEQIFEQLLRPANKNYFDYWRQRLKEELGSPDDERAILLLNTVCRDLSGVTKQTLHSALAKKIQDPEQRDSCLRGLLDILENDGYLIQDKERFQFRFPLLREYWLRRID